MSGLTNLGIVDKSETLPFLVGIYRGAQPEPEGYATLKGLGVKTVLNLREYHDEQSEVKEAGLIPLWYPMTVLHPVEVDVLNNIIEDMHNPVNQPIFVHCAQGQDRTSLVCAAYRMRVSGWTLEEAQDEMKMYILSPFGEIFLPILHRLEEFAEHERIPA